MISEAEAEAFLGALSAGVLKDLTGLAFPGSNTAMVIAPLAARLCFRALKHYNVVDLPALLDAVARVPFGRAHAVVETQAARCDLDAEVKREAVKFLSAIPMTSHQALHRFDDGGHVTTLVSQVPQTVEQVLRLMPARTPRFQPGDRIAGHDYRLEALLGQGGFAEVWKASHTELKGRAPVALKFCLDAALLPSLRQEIALVGRLQEDGADAQPDKGIVQLLGTGYSADPPFLVYEYVDGGNLCGWVDSFGDDTPSPRDVISVLKMAARAVALAHDHGIAHRDLKPANLLITREGRVKVGDFGIGRLVRRDGDGVSHDAGVGATQAAPLQQALTPVYSDPLRDPAAPAGLQDDVYALGVIGYQLLVGNVMGRMEGGWRRYLEARAVPAGLVEIVDTCVAPPAQRYADAAALLAALEALDAAAPKARPDTPHGAEDAAKRAAAAGWDLVKEAALRTPHAKAVRAGMAGWKRLKGTAEPSPNTEPVPEPEPEQRDRPGVKYCHECGTRAPADRRYCTTCGRRLA